MSRFARIDDVATAANERVGAGLEVANGFGASGFDDVEVGRESGGVGGFAGQERLEMFGPETEEDLPSNQASRVGPRGELDFQGPAATFPKNQTGTFAGLEGAADEVHRWGTEKAGDKGVARLVVKMQWATGLLKRAVAKHRDARSHGHGFGLIVGYVDDGGLKPLVEFDQFGAELGAHLGIKIGEGFVEEEDAGLADDGTADSDTLLLSAGKIAGHTREDILDAKDAGSLADAPCDVCRTEAPDTEAESEVLGDGEVGIERVVLEDHGDVAIAGRQTADVGIADENAAGGETFEAGNHTQGAGLATTGRTKQDNKRLVGDFQGQAKDGRDFLAAATAVDFGDVLKGDAGHGAGRVARFMGAGERRDAVNDDWCGPRRQGRGLRQNRV